MPSTPSVAHPAFADAADPLAYQQSALHDATRDWPQTNCYVDLWIEIVHALKMPPEAMMGFTTRLDFEGDQFTFFKPHLSEIEALYGLTTNELSIYDDLAGHLVQQCARGRLIMIEADSYFLPDTRGIAYRTEQTKTTIGVNRIDPNARKIDYFHNEGYFRAEGDDYEGIVAFGAKDGQRLSLPPYAEIVKIAKPALRPSALRTEARRLLFHHAALRPKDNPIAIFGATAPALLERLSKQPPEFFHKFAFNTLRQLGANFELMSALLQWLDGSEFHAEIEACAAISAGAKSLQFLVARAIMRQKMVGLEGPILALAERYDALFLSLDKRHDFLRAS